MTATERRDLRTGHAIWATRRHPAPTGQRLKRSVKADVVVIGAGISGAIMAQVLTERGVKPLILERRKGALLGSTAASTALLQFELDTPLTQLSRKVGRRAAIQAWRCSHAAVNELRTRANRLGIDANLHTRPSLYLAGDVLDAAGLRREVRMRQQQGFPSEYLNRKALLHHFNIHREAALLSHGNAEADPVALASGFLREAIRGGARLKAPHEVCDVHAHRRGVTLSTEDGLEIAARRVVFCTGYEFPRKMIRTTEHEIASTWAIATRRQPEKLWPQRALIWEASEPYLYVRTTPEGNVICGGEDEPYADEEKRDAAIPRKVARLEKKLAQLFPDLDSRATCAWAGAFGSSRRGLPMIGAIPGSPGCYAMMGYGGNGITFSMMGAVFLAAAVLGRPDPAARVFALP